MMVSLQANHTIIGISITPLYGDTKLLCSPTTLLQQRSLACDRFKVTGLGSNSNSSSTSGSSVLVEKRPSEDVDVMIDQTVELGTRTIPVEESVNDDTEIEYLVKEYGWKVRRMEECKGEIKKVADIQANAFHVPGVLFDDFFFHFFQAEVVAGLLYRLRNSPPDRYACLVAEPATEDDALAKSSQQDPLFAGVVDVTVLNDKDVLKHLEGAYEYIYVSGIAVSIDYRRQKVATVLLQACEVLAFMWGYEYLVLRAHEVDSGARALYTNAGYRLVSRDPIWVTWIGRKRRILMVKRLW